MKWIQVWMGLKLIKLPNVLSELVTVVSVSCAQDCPLSLGCPLPLVQPNAPGCPIKMEMGFVLLALWTHQELIQVSQAPTSCLMLSPSTRVKFATISLNHKVKSSRTEPPAHDRKAA